MTSNLPKPAGKSKTAERIRELQASSKANVIHRSSGMLFRRSSNGIALGSPQRSFAPPTVTGGAVWL